jgi:hypothetical protein
VAWGLVELAGPKDRWLVGFDDPTPDPRQLAEPVRAGVGRPDLPVRVDGVRQFSFVAALAALASVRGTFFSSVTPRTG